MYQTQNLNDEELKQQNAQMLQWLQQNKEQMSSAMNRPDRPAWETLLNPDTKRLEGEYSLSQAMDPRILESMQGRAFGDGPSQWRQMEEARQRDVLAKQGAGQQAQMQNRLAMSGGLRGGSGERMAQNQMNRQLLGGQNISRQMGLADEQRRQQGLGQLAQYQGGVEQYDIGQSLKENAMKRAADLASYKEQMQAWSSRETARATPSSGGGGMCFITTAVCEKFGLPDDNPILNKFRKFRDVFMGGKENVTEYYEVAPKIVAAIKERGDDGVYYDILAHDLIPALRAIEDGENEMAEAIYTDMVSKLKERYLGVSA